MHAATISVPSARLVIDRMPELGNYSSCSVPPLAEGNTNLEEEENTALKMLLLVYWADVMSLVPDGIRAKIRAKRTKTGSPLSGSRKVSCSHRRPRQSVSGPGTQSMLRVNFILTGEL